MRPPRRPGAAPTRPGRALGLLALAAGIAGSLPGAAAAARFRRVGIMTATAPELSPFRKAFRPHKTERVAGRDFLVGDLEGAEVVLVEGGVGKVNAAITATLLISRFEVDLLFFSGVGGGLHPDLALGDVVVSTRVVQGDYLKVADGKALPRPVKRLDHDGRHRSKFLAPPSVIHKVAVAAGQKSDLTKVLPVGGRKPKTFSGTICTQDAFITDEGHQRFLRSAFRGSVTEMEGAAMAQAARAAGVPWLVFRGISDHTNGGSSLLYPLARSRAAKNAAIVLLNTLYDLQGVRLPDPVFPPEPEDTTGPEGRTGDPEPAPPVPPAARRPAPPAGGGEPGAAPRDEAGSSRGGSPGFEGGEYLGFEP